MKRLAAIAILILSVYMLGCLGWNPMATPTPTLKPFTWQKRPTSAINKGVTDCIKATSWYKTTSNEDTVVTIISHADSGMTTTFDCKVNVSGNTYPVTVVYDKHDDGTWAYTAYYNGQKI